MVLRWLCLEKRNVYWIDKGGSEPQSELYFVNVYFIKTASTMKQVEFVVCQERGVLLNFSLEIWLNLAKNWHTRVGFLPVANEVDYSLVQRISERKCSGKRTISVTSELMQLENFIAHRQQSPMVIKKWWLSCKGDTKILECFSRSHNDRFDEITLSSSHAQLGHIMVGHRHDIMEGKTCLVWGVILCYIAVVPIVCYRLTLLQC